MKHRYISTLTALAAAVLISAGGLVPASVFLKEDIRSLKSSAEAVVHAKVVHVASYWTDALPRKELERKLHEAVRLARARLEAPKD